MVTLNLTILVQVGLFLLFLLAMHTFVFRPLLRVMDARDEKMADDKEAAVEGAAEAEKREAEYASKVHLLHREASLKIVHAHREAQAAHNEQVAGLKRKSEEELAVVRADMAGQVEAERQRYPELTDVLAHDMAARLGLEEDA